LDQPTLRYLEDDLYLVCEREEVLKLAPALQELAQRTGQLGAMHWLPYFFSTGSRISKPPYLVVQLAGRKAPGALCAEDIRAAALFFEYRIAGIRTGMFSTDDAVGYRTVIAARHERDRFASRAAQALLNSGAHIVLTNYDRSGDAPRPTVQGKALEGWRERTVRRILPLGATLEDTLAQFGQATRFNLRYYRRRLAKRVQLEFVEDARPHITTSEFAALNAASLNPLDSADEVDLRWNCSCELTDSFVVGLRSSDGKWISLIGGWRQETMTVLHWQMNAAGYEQDSIGTVMRSFFLEHEIARGARELLIFGGTAHTINRAFTEDTIVDLLLCRDTFRARVCRTVAQLLSRRISLLRSNHLVRTLAEVELHSSLQPVAPRLSSSSPAVVPGSSWR
jgi:hypothetical protein